MLALQRGSNKKTASSGILLLPSVCTMLYLSHSDAFQQTTIATVQLCLSTQKIEGLDRGTMVSLDPGMVGYHA